MSTYSYRLRSSQPQDTIAGVTFYAAVNIDYPNDQAALNAWVPTKLDRYVDGVINSTSMISLADETVTFNEKAKHEIEHSIMGISNGTFSNMTATGTITYAAPIVFIDATADNIVATLPSATSSVSRPIRIKRIDSSANTVTIAAGVSNTIDGDASVMMLPKDAFDLETNGLLLWSIF
jgi:hypothetical protein